MDLGRSRAFQRGFCGGAFGHPSSGARTVIDVGDHCIDCDRDTSFRSGLFVNRIPADDGEKDGYLCPDCQAVECGYCHEPTIEYGSDGEGDIICDDCVWDRSVDCAECEDYVFVQRDGERRNKNGAIICEDCADKNIALHGG